jgi:hypothetical protein
LEEGQRFSHESLDYIEAIKLIVSAALRRRGGEQVSREGRTVVTAADIKAIAAAALTDAAGILPDLSEGGESRGPEENDSQGTTRRTPGPSPCGDARAPRAAKPCPEYRYRRANMY